MDPSDTIIDVAEAFVRDTNPNKINLTVDAYRDDSGKPYVLPSVLEAEKLIMAQNGNMEYLMPLGYPTLRDCAKNLVFGRNTVASKGTCIASCQTLSGDCALTLTGMFIKKFHTSKLIYLPDPSTDNHADIFRESGLEVKKYAYYKKDTNGLNFKRMLEDINKIEEGAAIVLHVCGHNPTGIDLTKEQWNEISDLIRERKLLVILYMAHQGFATGDVEADAYAVRKFTEDGHTIMLSQSFSTNMGLYGHRIGTLFVVCDSDKTASAVESQLKIIIRTFYLTPVLYSARLVSTVLNTPDLYQQWLVDVKGMADRIIGMRSALKAGIVREGSVHNWDHLTNQIGMFCFTGMTPEQVDRLIKDHSVYLTKDGRISIPSVNSKNVNYLAHAIHQVTK